MSISNEEYLKANNNGQDTQHGHNGSGRGKRGKKKAGARSDAAMLLSLKKMEK